jgi:hypothetical protein
MRPPVRMRAYRVRDTTGDDSAQSRIPPDRVYE